MAFPEIYNVYINKPIHGLNIVIITNILESNQTGIHPQKYIGMSLGQQFSSLFFFSQTKLCKNQFNVFLPLSLSFNFHFYLSRFFLFPLAKKIQFIAYHAGHFTFNYRRVQKKAMLRPFVFILIKNIGERNGGKKGRERY